jgi:hypothetical protein
VVSEVKTNALERAGLLRRSAPLEMGARDVSIRVEWLVGRGYLSAESISLVLADPEKSYMQENKQERPELQAA